MNLHFNYLLLLQIKFGCWNSCCFNFDYILNWSFLYLLRHDGNKLKIPHNHVCVSWCNTQHNQHSLNQHTNSALGGWLITPEGQYPFGFTIDYCFFFVVLFSSVITGRTVINSCPRSNHSFYKLLYLITHVKLQFSAIRLIIQANSNRNILIWKCFFVLHNYFSKILK